jgi:hypothetical protein
MHTGPWSLHGFLSRHFGTDCDPRGQLSRCYQRRRNHVANLDVADYSAHEHTILGFNVSDVAATVKALRDKGAAFKIYRHFDQDELGMLSVPRGAVRMAWFNDPDGNESLSVGSQQS